MDGNLFIGNDDLCNAFSEEMSKGFEMSMFEEIKLLVRLKIQQKKDGIYINQSKYIKEILKKFGMEDSRKVGTPMSTRHKISKNDDSREVDQTTYRSMIGKLQDVVHTRPDISLVVGNMARF